MSAFGTDPFSFEFGEFRLAPAEHLLTCKGKPIPLTPKAFDLLLVLVRNSGHLVEKDDLLKTVWPDSFVEEANLSVNVSVLRKALGEAGGTGQYIETVPKRGYRFVPKVSAVSPRDEEFVFEVQTQSRVTVEEEEEEIGEESMQALPSAGVSDMQGRALPPAASKTRLAKIPAWSALLLILALAFAYFIRSKGFRPETPLARVQSIAVLPFRPLNSASQDEYLGIGMQEVLTTRLGGLSQLVVRQIYESPAYSGTEQDPVMLGNKLGVDAILSGTIQRVNDRLRVSARLLDTQSGKQLWGGVIDEKAGDLLAAEDSISGQVADALEISLSTAERSQFLRRGTQDAEAYDFYLKGVYIGRNRTAGSLEKGIQYFQAAIDKDPSFALAYLGLSQYYYLFYQYRVLSPRDSTFRAAAAAKKALEIDPSLAQAHVILGNLAFYYDLNGERAEEEFRLARQLRPNDPTTCFNEGLVLALQGRFDEALTLETRFDTLNPLDPRSGKFCVLYFARRYDDAIKEGLQLLKLQPNLWVTHLYLGMIYEQTGDKSGAFTELQRAADLSGGDQDAIACLGHAQALFGNAAAAQRALRKLESLSKRGYVSPYGFAIIYAGLGDRDRALQWLEKAYEDRSAWWLASLKVEPRLDSLRSDSRFVALLHRMNFGS